MINRPTFTSPLECPTPAGPYNHVVVAGDFAFTAGQVGVNPESGQLAGDDIVSQTRQAITNLASALVGARLGLDAVVSVKVYLTDDNHFNAMNEVYRDLFPQPFPARSTIVTGLRPGILVELDAIAFTGIAHQ